MGKMQAMVTTLQSQNAQATSSFRQGNPSFGIRGRGRMPFHSNCRRGVSGGRGLPPKGRWRGQPQPQRPNSQPNITQPQQKQGNVKTYIDNQCWQCGEMGHLKKELSHAKRQGPVSGRECINSPTAQGHPPISKASNIGGKKMASNNNTPSKFLNPDP